MEETEEEEDEDDAMMRLKVPLRLGSAFSRGTAGHIVLSLLPPHDGLCEGSSHGDTHIRLQISNMLSLFLDVAHQKSQKCLVMAFLCVNSQYFKCQTKTFLLSQL